MPVHTEGRCTMWVIELNVAGLRFTRQVRRPHAPTLTVRPRDLLRHTTQLLLDRVA
ncbi:hypothetical protein M1247_27085 [Mycobacterium sp. 21AC1]|uniref:hypothetical protein n=1 Tax=[Mycobacterium] appelbergii TaxID=2939269 RepID=UPI0029393AF0|nr:hypothetical protein [Mycobacterium sp. 21AC1]MDV3128598.1 hypothetical protein [Mycobacterium sp. 21AC1]